MAITPDGAFAYVANFRSHNVSVIATATNTVVATVGVGKFPNGVAMAPAPLNEPPEIAPDTDPVAVSEGQTASNTGTVSDPDGDNVTLSASVGSITNNSDGTWSWNFPTSDGPAESQMVTIDADDNNGGMAQATFTLTVNNVAPDVTPSANQTATSGVATSFTLGSFTDPGDDDPWEVKVDWDDLSADDVFTVGTPGSLGSLSHTYADAGVYTVTVTVTEENGTEASGSAQVEVAIVHADSDNDGVFDSVDFCAGTSIPETVPIVELKPNRWALVDGDFEFDTVKKGKGKGPGLSYSTTDTGGCSCEQIIDELGLGNGHTKFGCSISAMDDWVEFVNPSKRGAGADAAEVASVPEAFVLEAVYPNPFNPQTTLRFDVPEASHVSLLVYDVLGRQVLVLVDGTREAGTHEVVFEASTLPSGTYLVRLVTPAGSFVQTMQLVK